MAAKAIGKNLFVDFPNMETNPFVGADGGTLLVAVCGAMQIRTSKCLTYYDAERKVATIQFHYNRPSWALKGAERIHAMRTFFASSQFRFENAPPPPSSKDLGLDQAV